MFLNDMNAEIITVVEIREGDYITMTSEPANGFEVESVQGSIIPNRREIRGNGIYWAAPHSTKVRRLVKEAGWNVGDQMPAAHARLLSNLIG